jgi:hypothetical protein
MCGIQLTAGWYPLDVAPSKYGKNTHITERSRRIRAAIWARSAYYQITMNLLILILIVPTLTCVGVGVISYSGKAEWQASYGIGFDMYGIPPRNNRLKLMPSRLIAVIVLLFLAFCLMMFTGDGGTFLKRQSSGARTTAV